MIVHHCTCANASTANTPTETTTEKSVPQKSESLPPKFSDDVALRWTWLRATSTNAGEPVWKQWIWAVGSSWLTVSRNRCYFFFMANPSWLIFWFETSRSIGLEEFQWPGSSHRTGTAGHVAFGRDEAVGADECLSWVKLFFGDSKINSWDPNFSDWNMGKFHVASCDDCMTTEVSGEQLCHKEGDSRCHRL